MSRFLPPTGFVLCWLAVPATFAQAGDAQIEFNRDIRPILSNNCFACHGPDAATREAGLRLDTFDAATEDFGGYQPIEPGDPLQSEVIRRVTSSEDYDVMPLGNMASGSPNKRSRRSRPGFLKAPTISNTGPSRR
jgi:hypothetical protein